MGGRALRQRTARPTGRTCARAPPPHPHSTLPCLPHTRCDQRHTMGRLCCLLVLLAVGAASLGGGAAAWELADPSDVIEGLSAGEGVEGSDPWMRWKRPDFCGESCQRAVPTGRRSARAPLSARAPVGCRGLTLLPFCPCHRRQAGLPALPHKGAHRQLRRALRPAAAARRCDACHAARTPACPASPLPAGAPVRGRQVAGRQHHRQLQVGAGVHAGKRLRPASGEGG